MRKTLFILFVLLIAEPVFSQNQTEFTVINILGAKVHDKPTFDSKELRVLSTGVILISEKQIQSTEKFDVGTDFSLTGMWIKPRDIKGYIFSSDLTDKKVQVEFNGDRKTRIIILGKLLKVESKEEKVKTPIGEFPKYFEHKYYENGSYTEIFWDGCFDRIRKYKGLTVNEVYHQMLSDYAILMNGNQLLLPHFLEKVGSKLKFKIEEATEDLTINLKEDGSIIVSSYDCL